MSVPSASYLKVPYDIRPAKQVERRMIVDSLHRLLAGGFAIREYQYTGFGSVYFVDFIMLHKLVGIHRLLSVEYDGAIEKRVDFNRPFALVEVRMAAASDVIPDLDRDLRHVLWLDYDDLLQPNHLQDVIAAAFVLSPGSLLLVTVDVEPPVDGGDPAAWKAYYEERAGDYFDSGWTLDAFGLSQLPRTIARTLFNAITHGLNGRQNIVFVPLYNFVYKDGHRMLTVGGMIASQAEVQRLSGCKFVDAPYIRRDASAEPYEIRVPRITRKERLYLDRFMPCADGWTPEEFELSAEIVTDYREVYRYLPAYAELLL